MEEKFQFVSIADLRATLRGILQEQGTAAASKEQAPAKDLLTTKEVCGIFNVAPITLWKWRKQGYINPVQVGGKKLYYNRAEVERLKTGNV